MGDAEQGTTTGEQRLEQRLRRLIDAQFSFVGLLDPAGTILEANQTALAAVGLERSDVVGLPFWETHWWSTSAEVRDQLRDAIHRAADGETVRYDVEVALADGVMTTMDFQLVPLFEDGEVTALVPSAIDISDRRQQGDRLLALAEFAQSLAVASHTDDVADAVREQLARALGATFANLALVGEDGRTATLVHSPGLEPSIAVRYAELDLDADTPLTDAIRSGRTIVVADAAENASRYPHLVADSRGAGLVASVAVPLSVDGEVAGAIGVAWNRPLERDASFDARLHTIARLTADTLARTRTADAQAALISELQHILHPVVPDRSDLQVAVRYQAAGAALGFGGDWYDVIELDEATTAIVVGDVVGHGIEAAARMVVVRSAINVGIQLGAPLADLFTVTGPVVGEGRTSFVGTAVVLLVDTEAQEVRYAGAGHPPVVVRYPDGTTRLLDDANGLVLGLPDRSAVAGSAPFPPGSVAVAYTDGMVETRAEPIDVGIARLTAGLVESHDAGHDAEQTAEHLLARLGDAADLTDDIALVVLRHTAP
jgi:PAS domain S-box-containing protein